MGGYGSYGGMGIYGGYGGLGGYGGYIGYRRGGFIRGPHGGFLPGGLIGGYGPHGGYGYRRGFIGGYPGKGGGKWPPFLFKWVWYYMALLTFRSLYLISLCIIINICIVISQAFKVCLIWRHGNNTLGRKTIKY